MTQHEINESTVYMAALPEPDPASPWMTRQEAADYLRVDVRTVDRWVKEGRLPRHKIKGIQSVRFSRADIERQVELDPEDGPTVVPLPELE